ncbi:hypothetical protein BJX76DRAFT_299629 [Aspergillus varians]
MGGFVFKNALCISREQHYNYRPVIDVISGAIFLGSPHLELDPKQAKVTLDLLLRCQNKCFGRSLTSNNDLMAGIDICKSFELINLNVRVISVYESQDTQTERKVFAKFFGRHRNASVSSSSTPKIRWNGADNSSIAHYLGNYKALVLFESCPRNCSREGIQPL